MLYVVFRRTSAPAKAAKERIAFLSRQSKAPSLDFTLLEAALRARLPGWEVATSCYRDKGGLIARVIGTLRHLRLVATSRLCIVDGYTPAVSIPRLDPSLAVVQLWHALGTFKRFGWQAVDSSEGRTRLQAEQLRMHRNYSLIIAGGEGARNAYAQAFDCPPERIAPLGMPRMDYLLEDGPSCRRRQAVAAIVEQHPSLDNGRVNVLFVPTFRRQGGREDARRSVQELADRLPSGTYNLIVSFHPFSVHGSEAVSSVNAGSNGRAPIIHIPHTKGIDLLELADYVVTDYSAIAFEAALLRRKVVFYVPDIAAYRISPGLNLDPEQRFPTITFREAAPLASYLQRDLEEDCYASSGLWPYCDAYLAQPAKGATERLAEHLAEMVR